MKHELVKVEVDDFADQKSTEHFVIMLQMRLTWISGDKKPQQVKYGNGKSETSEVTTFSRDDMCSEFQISTLPAYRVGLN